MMERPQGRKVAWIRWGDCRSEMVKMQGWNKEVIEMMERLQ